ncbi:MAG: hypothetical protein Q9214_002352 [Letrouitia sp. 1 TL-2023]
MPLSSDDSSPPATTNNDENHKRGYLNGHISHIRCARCATDLCSTSQIISKGFTGRHGRAYLVSAAPIASPLADPLEPACRSGLPNTRTHKPVPRQLVTGAHTVSDVSCAFCGSVIGWKYDSAEEETQRYKVGKFILETKKIFSSSSWEGDDEPGDPTALLELNDEGKRSVEFDSGDEDECEDLFAGVWSPTLATKRRQGKRLGRCVAEEPLKPDIA